MNRALHAPPHPVPCLPRGAVLLVLAAMALAGVSEAAAAETTALRVKRSDARLRAETGFGGPVVRELPVGELLEELRREREWIRVRGADGVTGWLHEVFVEPVPDGVAREPARAPPVATRPPRPLESPRRPRTPVPPPAEEEEEVAGPDRDLAACRLERESLRREREELRRALEELATERDELSDERDELLGLLSEARSAVAGARTALEGAEQRAEAERREACGQAVHDARERLRREHEEELAGLRREHEEELRRLEERQDEIGERFVRDCAALHERELARQLALAEAAFEERLAAEREKHEEERRKVAKESGWQAELEKEVKQQVREKVRIAVEEERARCRARQRGDEFELERKLREREEELERECEQRVLAVSAEEAARHREALSEQARRIHAEEARRCQYALRLVLERAAAGDSLEDLRARPMGPFVRPDADGTPGARRRPGGGTGDASDAAGGPPR